MFAQLILKKELDGDIYDVHEKKIGRRKQNK